MTAKKLEQWQVALVILMVILIVVAVVTVGVAVGYKPPTTPTEFKSKYRRRKDTKNQEKHIPQSFPLISIDHSELEGVYAIKTNSKYYLTACNQCFYRGPFNCRNYSISISPDWNGTRFRIQPQVDESCTIQIVSCNKGANERFLRMESNFNQDGNDYICTTEKQSEATLWNITRLKKTPHPNTIVSISCVKNQSSLFWTPMMNDHLAEFAPTGHEMIALIPESHDIQWTLEYYSQ
jgi:hypothetical protein